MLDALATANKLRPVFEPLHPAVSNTARHYAYRALDPDNEHAKLQHFLRQVCAGRCCRMWTHYRGRPDLLLPPPRRLLRPGSLRIMYHRWRKFLDDRPELAAAARHTEPLVKCIRANLMLGWWQRWLGDRVVLVVRHPGAVVESQVRLGSGTIWDPEPVLDRYRRDEVLHEWTGNRYRSLLNRPLSRLEGLAINWVIENQMALENVASQSVTVVFYEILKASAAREWQRVCQALELPAVPEDSVLSRPSQQSSEAGVETAAAGAEPGWMRRLAPEHARRIQQILDEVGCGTYAMDDPMPRSGVAGR
ncbi:MAG: hypothetical protein EPO25_16255 [Gammaproteobacteria bacterium]|nr:MAG: hypothetical protein EPO25_16255 [Gammaproteobacteria bacterium]